KNVSQLAEVQLWHKALTTVEIREDMMLRAGTEDPLLVARWPLAGGEGTEVPESKGRFIGVGNRRNDTWKTAEDLPLFAKKSAKDFLCRYFDGKGAHIVVPANDSFRAPAFSIQAWVRPDKSDVKAISSPVATTRSPGYGWALGCSGTEAIFIVADSRGKFQVVNFKHTTTNTWVHIAGVWTGQEAILFVNGLKVGAKRITGYRSRNTELRLGNQPHWGGRNFSGRISEVRFYTSPRSSTEIQSDMFQCAFTSTGDARVNYGDGFAHCWPLNDTDSATAKDARGGLHGSYKGATPSDTAGWQLIGMEPANIELQELSNQIQELEGERTVLRKQLDARTSANLHLQQQLAQLSKLPTQVTKLNQQVASLHKQIAARDKRIAEFEAKQAKQSLSVSLDDFIDTTNAQIRQARARLAEDQRNLRLGRVSIDLKVVPDEDGRAFRFPKLANNAGLVDLEPGKLSNLIVEFEDNEPPPAPPSTREVPDIGGYTEAMARRMLTEAGFTMTAHAQAVGPNGSADYGRVLTQHPPPGEQAAVNANILVFIGKEA
ncbi:MAG: LamG-like jellyroll fold domain-containing protein, partial [Nannocystaceae bacterium]